MELGLGAGLALIAIVGSSYGALVGGMVEDICYRNAARYFGLEAGRFDPAPGRPTLVT